MRRFAATFLALSLAGPAHAAPAEAPATPSAKAPNGSLAEVMDRAERAWNEGKWSEVRTLLEPVALDEAQLHAPRDRERALLFLADATLNDDTLDEAVRRRLAGAHLDRILAGNPVWRMPEGIYTPELFALYQERLDAQASADAAQCAAERNACRADLAEEAAEHQTLEERHTDLQQRYGTQMVEVREQVKRSRGWALIPFGVGHFYNGNVTRKGTTTREEKRNIGLGATFMLAEAGFGLTGLGLLLWRTTVAGCSREGGFATGSLHCTFEDPNARGKVFRRRRAEEWMGWFFLSTMALDVLVAQLLFKPVTTTSIDRKPRNELDREQSGKPSQPRKRRPRAQVRPTPAFLPAGGGIGVDIRF